MLDTSATCTHVSTTPGQLPPPRQSHWRKPSQMLWPLWNTGRTAIRFPGKGLVKWMTISKSRNKKQD
eukprot:4615667-Amphidinium_carterae.2